MSMIHSSITSSVSFEKVKKQIAQQSIKMGEIEPNKKEKNVANNSSNGVIDPEVLKFIKAKKYTKPPAISKERLETP